MYLNVPLFLFIPHPQLENAYKMSQAEHIKRATHFSQPF